MDIFKRKKSELPPLLSDADLIDYSSVLEWLVGLSDDDYAKVCKVAEIHRKAYQDAAGALGKPNEPVTFIDSPEEYYSDDPAFIVDDHESAASRRQRKVAEKAAK